MKSAKKVQIVKFRRNYGRFIYVVVNLLSQVSFTFLLLQIHWHTLPYPKTKEKQKLPEIKNNYNIYISRANECSVDAFVVAKFDVEIRELLGEFWLRSSAKLKWE